MRYERRVVTPVLAAEWLKANTHNRPRSLWWERLYGRQMLSGHWHETHQGIAFTEDGVLADGQTRLRAIVNTGVTVVLWVAFDLTADALLVLDQLRVRTIAQNLTLSGITASQASIATLRSFIVGFAGAQSGDLRMSSDEALHYMQKHSDALAFAFEAMPAIRKKGNPAMVRGLIARASYREDHDLLRMFCSILLTGDSSQCDRPARVVILLRDLLMAGSNRGNRADRAVVYGKASRALRAFLDGENINKLYSATSELFELPEETPVEQTA